MKSDEELIAMLEEAVMEARKLLETSEEAFKHLSERNFQSACDVLSLSRYKVSGYQTAVEGAMEAFAARGIKPGGTH